MNSLLLLSVALGITQAIVPLPSWERWVEQREVEGVRIYVAEDAGLPWGRAEGELAVPPEAVLAHLVEFEQMVGRVPRMVEARVLRRGEGEAVVYCRVDLPWPISDRDWTARYQWRRERSDQVVVDIEDAEAEGPGPGDPVRVRGMRARFTVTAIGPTRTLLGYEFRADFGGWLPRTVRAQANWRMPLETVAGIRKFLEGEAQRAVAGGTKRAAVEGR